MIAEIVKVLGFWGTFILLSLPFAVFTIIAGVLILLHGLKNPMNGVQILIGIRKPRVEESKPTTFSDNLILEFEVDKEPHGFQIPEGYVILYGKKWNREHVEYYRMLEDRWVQCPIVDITRANVTSSLVSLLEDKADQLGSLKIFATADQVVLLNYPKPNTKIQRVLS